MKGAQTNHPSHAPQRFTPKPQAAPVHNSQSAPTAAYSGTWPIQPQSAAMANGGKS